MFKLLGKLLGKTALVGGGAVAVDQLILDGKLTDKFTTYASQKAPDLLKKVLEKGQDAAELTSQQMAQAGPATSREWFFAACENFGLVLNAIVAGIPGFSKTFGLGFINWARKHQSGEDKATPLVYDRLQDNLVPALKAQEGNTPKGPQGQGLDSSISSAPTANSDLKNAALFGTGIGAATMATTTAASKILPKSGAISKLTNFVLGGTTKGRLVRAAIIAGGATAIAAADDDSPARDPNQPVSLLDDPKAFAADLGDGLEDVFTKEKWDNGENVEAAENLGKAGLRGLFTGAAWMGGQAVDIVDWGLDVVGTELGFERDLDDNYSEDAVTWTADSSDYVMENYLGGAPDLNGAWAQTANFAGGTLGGVGTAGLGAKVLRVGGNLLGKTARSVGRMGGPQTPSSASSTPSIRR